MPSCDFYVDMLFTHLTHRKCYLCPGNARAAGDSNPQYEKTFAFVNDYSAVKEQQPDYDVGQSTEGILDMPHVLRSNQTPC
jgi:galactose-1-phosphate uridylyltransferase